MMLFLDVGFRAGCINANLALNGNYICVYFSSFQIYKKTSTY